MPQMLLYSAEVTASSPPKCMRMKLGETRLLA